MNAPQQIVRVPFHDDVIDAVHTEDGKILISIRRVCESLGIAVQSQLARLKSRSWACVTMIVTHDESGRRQELAMIDHESLPIWMTHINPLKVAPSVREKIDLFQREAKAVLAAWFLGAAPPNAAKEKPIPSPHDHLRMLDIYHQLEAAREMGRRWLTACKALGETADAMLRADDTTIDVPICPVVTPVALPVDPEPVAEPVAEPAPVPDVVLELEPEEDTHEYLTFWRFCEIANVRVDGRKPTRTARAVFSAEASKMSADLGVPVKKEPSTKFGTINLYRIDVLWAWKEKHDKREAESAERARLKAEASANKPRPTHTQPRFNFLERNGVAH